MIQEKYEERPKFWYLYIIIAAILILLISWSASDISFNGLAIKGVEVASGIFHGIISPDKDILFTIADNGVPYLLLQTIAIAILGTFFGAILAIPFSFLSTSKIVPKPIAAFFGTINLLIRTIPTLVWALMWIRVTGPGPFCGVVTQSVCSIGMMSKMNITAIEDLDTDILESLDAMGCTTFQKIRYGIIPQLISNFISTTIYRFDINLKDASTLGIVGAGGIGAALIQSLNSRRWSTVGSFIFGLMVLVLIIEFLSTKIRTKLARG